LAIANQRAHAVLTAPEQGVDDGAALVPGGAANDEDGIGHD
jgi:hypothetical protein